MGKIVREPAAEEWEDVAEALYDLVCEEVGWDTEAAEQYRRLQDRAHKARTAPARGRAA